MKVIFCIFGTLMLMSGLAAFSDTVQAIALVSVWSAMGVMFLIKKKKKPQPPKLKLIHGGLKK